MKKLRVLILLAAVFVLFSCDYILEFYYGEGIIGKGILTIQMIIQEVNNLDGQVSAESPIRIGVIPFYQEGDGRWEMAPWDFRELDKIIDPEVVGMQPGIEENIFKRTFNVGRGLYQAIIWYDKNNNGRVDPGEPADFFRYFVENQYGGVDEFDVVNFADPDSPKHFDVFGFLFGWSRIPEDLIVAIWPETEKLGIDFGIGGPRIFDRDALPGMVMYEILTPPGATYSLDSFKWTISHLTETGEEPQEIGLLTVHPVVGGVPDFFVDMDDIIGRTTEGWHVYKIIIEAKFNIPDKEPVITVREAFFNVLDELDDGTTYKSVVDLFDLGQKPVNLDWDVEYKVEVWIGPNPDFENWSLGAVTMLGNDTGGNPLIVHDGWMNAALQSRSYAKSPGIEWALILLDVGGNGTLDRFEQGDWFALVPIIAEDSADPKAKIGSGPWGFQKCPPAP